jgi:recombination protein RecT
MPDKKNEVVVLKEQLESRLDTFRTALPPHIKPDRFIAVAQTTANLNTDLYACERRSLFMALVKCAQDGLMPDGTEAAIVPYKTKAQYIPMFQGLLKKFRNSGQFKWIKADVVYDGEFYEHWIDETGEHFKHVPNSDLADPSKIKRVYAVATTKDGGFFVEDMSLKQINKRKAMSKASRDDAPWKQWPEEMMKKTALRALSKILPKSSDLDAFIQRDEEESLGIQHATSGIEQSRIAAFGTALDHFSGDEPPKDGDAAAGAQAAANRADAAASPPKTTDAIGAARELGRKGFRDGLARRAVPPELREPNRSAEALAWTEGWDLEQKEAQQHA